jgi:hypothetical protein
MRDENQNPLCGHAYLHDGNSVSMIHFIVHQIVWEKILLNVIESEEPSGYFIGKTSYTTVKFVLNGMVFQVYL